MSDAFMLNHVQSKINFELATRKIAIITVFNLKSLSI